MWRLDKYWRAFATGLCFVLFGLGALILGFIVFPVFGIFARDEVEKQRRAQRVIQHAFKLFLFGIKFTGAGEIEFVGMEKLAKDRGCLIVANHPSLIDYVMIASSIPQCDCVVKSAIYKNFFVKRTVLAAGYVSNKDVVHFFDKCTKRLQKGNVLLIFPEGTRTTPNENISLVRGAAQIATHAKVDLRLIHITVNPSFLTKADKWYKVPRTKPVFRVEAKDVIKVEPFLQGASSVNSAARRLNCHLAKVLFPKMDN